MLATLGEALKVLWHLFAFSSATAESTYNAMSSNVLTAALGAFLGYFLKMVTPLLYAAAAGAFVLANLLPMIPIITFVFVVVGYLVVCAEALGGIALGSALLASSVGDGLMAVHGLRMAALYGAIFLRPSLHIIGLMLGYAMCNVSLALLNSVWWDGLGNSNVQAWDVFDLAFIIGGYPLVLFGLVTYNLKAINFYANNLMSWIATEAIGQFGDHDNYVDSTKSTFKSMQSGFDGALQSKDKEHANAPRPGNAGDSNAGGPDIERPVSATR